MKKRKFLLLVLTLGLFLVGCASEDKLESRKEFLMDTIVELDLYGSGNKKAMDQVYDELFDIEKKLSKTISKSDIFILNRDKKARVQDETYYILEKSKDYSRRSKGIFEPTIGGLVSLWDIKADHSNRGLPDPKEIERLLANLDYEKIELGADNMVEIASEQSLDLGAVVKGYAADRARDILLENQVKSAIIDLGGNIYALGSKPSGEAWRIGIKDPAEKEDFLGILSVKDKSVVTSGDYERYFEYESKRYHHIIDPRTGYPADNDLRSVTIVSDSSMDGDAYSTIAFILGLEEGLEFVQSMEDIEAIFVTKDAKVYITQGLRDKFELKAQGYKLMDS